MSPPTHEQIQSIVAKKLSPDQLKNLLDDLVKSKEDLELLSSFLLAATVTYQQVLAVINGQYEIKQTVKKDSDGTEKKSISLNFDLSGIPDTTLDKAKNRYGDGILKRILETSDKSLRSRLMKGLVPDGDLDTICGLIEQKKQITDLATLEAIIAHDYTLVKGVLKFKKSLDLIRDPSTNAIDSAQLDLIQSGDYTPNQLVRLFNNQFNVDEIKAIFACDQIDKSQLAGLLNGKYEVHRKELDDGKGLLIEIRFKRESYKQYLEDILAGKVPLDTILQLFANRYGPEEITAILSLNLTPAQLHALITGDYVVERVDNPDGSYSLNITYRKGAGCVTEIDVAPEPTAAKPVEAKTKAADETKPKAEQPKPAEEKPQQAPPKPEPIVAKGTVKGAKDKFLKAEAIPIAKPVVEEPKKVKIPDFGNEKEWSIDKGSKLKIPAMFASAVKPNFHKTGVKHLEKGQIKGFYDLETRKH